MAIFLQSDQAPPVGHLQTHQTTAGAASEPRLVASSAQRWPLGTPALRASTGDSHFN